MMTWVDIEFPEMTGASVNWCQRGLTLRLNLGFHRLKTPMLLYALGGGPCTLNRNNNSETTCHLLLFAANGIDCGRPSLMSHIRLGNFFDDVLFDDLVPSFS